MFGLVGLRVLKAARGVRSGVVAAFDVRLAAAMADAPFRFRKKPFGVTKSHQKAQTSTNKDNLQVCISTKGTTIPNCLGYAT